MRSVILGVGDAFTRQQFGFSALLEGQDGYVLLNCPDLVHRAIRQLTAKSVFSICWRC